jgi:hypothetical protein
MQIRQIGNKFESQIIQQIEFESNDYFLDLDILIIDIQYLKKSFENKLSIHSSTGIKCFPHSSIVQYKANCVEKNTQIMSFLKNGGSLLIFNSNLSKIDYKSVERIQVNEEKIHENSINLLDYFGLNSDSFIFESRKGSNILVDNCITDIFTNFETNYDFVLTKHSGNAIIFVKNTNESLGIKISKNGGNIFLLPNINFRPNVPPFISILIKFHEAYKSTNDELSESELPIWCNSFLLENESKDRNKLIKLNLSVSLLNEQIKHQHEIIKKHDDLKRILISTGDELELQITKLFYELGYEIIEAELNRDDIIIKKNESIAVIEIKGVKGSSAEKHAAQLMKWVNTYHYENEIQPKGILIVNGFKDTPIHERKEKVFTNQMLPYCIKMEICLLTTLQLLKIIMLFRSGKIKLEEIHDGLFQTIGEFETESISLI